MSGVSPLHLGPVSLPLWLMLVILAFISQTHNPLKLKTQGGSPVKYKLKTVLFPLTGFAEMVWDIGTKVVAASVCGLW